MKASLTVAVVIMFAGLLCAQQKPSDITSYHQIARDMQPVTIKKRKAHIREIIEEFRKQVRVSIDLDPIGITEEDIIDEFIVENVPFRQVFEAFLRKSGLSIVEETPYLICLAKPEKIDIRAEDATVEALLETISRATGINIVISMGVKEHGKKNKIRLRLKNIPWTHALDAIVKTAGVYAIREDYNLIRVLTFDELQGQFETRVFKLKYIFPPAEYMGKLACPAPRYVEAGVEKEKVAKLAKALKKFYLIDILTPMLTTVNGKTIGKINYDHQRNLLIITDTKTVLNKIEKVLRVLDVEPLQVVIDVKQVVTTNSDIVDFGLSFGTPETPIKITTWPTITPGASSPPGAKQTKLPFGLGHESPVSSTYFLTQYEVMAVLRAIKQDKFTKISQRPTIACLDNHEATIFVGQTVRFAETRVEYSQYGTPSKGIQEAKNSPVEIGFQLLVIPRIIRGTNRIMLTVVPTDSALISLDKYETADYMIQLPQTSTTTLVTTLIIDSGHTAVIGGLTVERTKHEENKVPILGDLPLINPLFKHTYKEKVKEHLLVFLTPRIVRSAKDMVAELKRKLELRQKEETKTKK